MCPSWHLCTVTHLQPIVIAASQLHQGHDHFEHRRLPAFRAFGVTALEADLESSQKKLGEKLERSPWKLAINSFNITVYTHQALPPPPPPPHGMGPIYWPHMRSSPSPLRCGGGVVWYVGYVWCVWSVWYGMFGKYGMFGMYGRYGMNGMNGWYCMDGRYGM